MNVYLLSELLQVHRTLSNKCFFFYLHVRAVVISVILSQTLAEDRGGRLLRITGNYVSDYQTLHPRSQQVRKVAA